MYCAWQHFHCDLLFRSEEHFNTQVTISCTTVTNTNSCTFSFDWRRKRLILWQAQNTSHRLRPRWIPAQLLCLATEMTDGSDGGGLILTNTASCYNACDQHGEKFERAFCRFTAGIRDNPDDDDGVLNWVIVGLFSFFVSATFPKTPVCLLELVWQGGPAWPGSVSLGSHRISCPIAGRRCLKWGRITLSQQTTGNRKTEYAASRRSFQPSTISHGLIGLRLHLLHQNRSFRSGLVCPGIHRCNIIKMPGLIFSHRSTMGCYSRHKPAKFISKCHILLIWP